MSRRPSVLIIAEIGVNHGGLVEEAYRLIDAAKKAGADAVKFQTFSADRLATKATPKVAYQERLVAKGQSHLEMLRSLELSPQDHRSVFDYCRKLGIEFISTPYDVSSVDLLEDLGVKQYKVASADLVDLFLLRRLAATGKPLLLSVGMATLGEIETALNTIDKAASTSAGRSQITLLHCVSNYPCAIDSLNLLVIKTLQSTFGLPVGFSDHSEGPLASALSIAMGATVVEKHFTIDQSADGPDHAASSTPDQFATLVLQIRQAERMLGGPAKKCQDEERQMAEVSRKSLTLSCSLKKGQTLSLSHLSAMRPGTGLQPIHLDSVLGRAIRRDLDAGHQIDWADLERPRIRESKID